MGRMFQVKWQPWGPLGSFFSTSTAALGTAWTDGVDTRWEGLICLPPGRTAVDISSEGTSANVNCEAVVMDSSGNPYIYISRGTGLAKVEPSTMALITGGSPPAAQGARIVCLLPTKAPNGNWQLSQFDGSNSYKVRTTIASNRADTSSNNDQSSSMKVAYAADGDHNVWGVENKSTTKGWTVRRNVLSTSVNMDASNWLDVSSLTAGAAPTGLSISDNILIIGTDHGPMIMRTDTGEFVSIIARVSQDANNCRAMKFVDWLGVIMGVGNQIRVQRGAQGARIGPSLWKGNDGNIQGKLQGIAFDMDYIYCAIRNAVAGKTYFLAAKPGSGSDGLDWYCIGSQTEDCEFMADWGNVEGDRTQPIIGAGKGTDAFWYALKGRTPRWIDDSNYVYDSGTDYTWYGTELRLAKPARIVGVSGEGQGITSARTVKIQARVMGSGGTSESHDLLGLTTPGAFVKPLPINNRPQGTRIRPQMVLRTDSAAASPQFVGELTLDLEEL